MYLYLPQYLKKLAIFTFAIKGKTLMYASLHKSFGSLQQVVETK